MSDELVKLLIAVRNRLEDQAGAADDTDEHWKSIHLCEDVDAFLWDYELSRLREGGR